MWVKGLVTIKMGNNSGNIVKIDNPKEWESWKLKIKRDKKTLEEDFKWLSNQQEEDIKVLGKLRGLDEKIEEGTIRKIETMESLIKRKREEIRKMENILKDWEKYEVYKIYANKKGISEIYVGKLDEVIQWQ